MTSRPKVTSKTTVSTTQTTPIPTRARVVRAPIHRMKKWVMPRFISGPAEDPDLPGSLIAYPRHKED